MGVDELWASLWRSWARSLAAWIAVSACIASILYAFNWHTFYDTRFNMASDEAARIALDIEALRGVVEGEGALRGAVRGYASGRRHRIAVEAIEGDRVVWRESNEAPLDPGRTRLERRFEIAGGPGTVGLRIDVQRSVRPPLATALLNAWTFSLPAYLEDPERWQREHWVNRSIPLYGYLLTVLLVGLGTVVAFHRDQVEKDRLVDEAGDIGAQLEDVRRRGAQQIADLRERATTTASQRDEAIRERERLLAEIDTVERETRDLHASGGDGKVEVHDVRLQSIADRKARVERALASHDATVASYEKELEVVRDELGAAEDILQEVEARQGSLQDKLRERNRQIRQLQDLVRRARDDSHRLELETARRTTGASSDRAESGRALESQLDDWLDAPGEAQVNFSEHSRTVVVEKAFAKIDRAFVDRHFTHVHNPEYERGAHRVIRVNPEPAAGDAPQSGLLVVALDDDAGRTLGLRYVLRPNAPDATHVGFVLAMLLRDHCREFRGYEIRARS